MLKEIIKSINVVILILWLMGFSSIDAYAAVKKKIGIDPFQNPQNWAKSYDMGSLLYELIKREIILKDEYRLVQSVSMLTPVAEDGLQESDVDGTKGSKMSEDKKTETPISRHPAQLLVQGRVLSFSSKVLPGSKKAISEEHTELIVEVVLFNPRTQRNVGVRYFKRDSQREQKPGESIDINDPLFRNSSTGAVMELVAKDALYFVQETLNATPFDADIIEVDEKSNMVVINAGAKDGVQLFDLFRVYWVTNGYHDNSTQVDLGDRLMPMGVVKIETIQDDFAVARIMAGNKFKVGSLVRARNNNPVLANK